ncbi:hypothetical protein ACJ72_08444 [Emergomyces africanus]|uniref:DUF3955 domain-containing protein n=1 Tax=Emergomyces africanus TaxID=1955775 RepID=A0A1B7NL04_9EURO|nr:hypothetical protein ACJ72_08444 [Emergomyces africanus]
MSTERLVGGVDGELQQQQQQQQQQQHHHRTPIEDMQVDDEVSGSVPPSAQSRSRSRSLNSELKRSNAESTRLPLGIPRRTLGIILLLIVVVLWTASNFLASTIFSDNTYSKPFFVTYLNTTFFIFPLLSILGHRLFQMWRAGKLSKATTFRTLLDQLDSHETVDESSPFLTADDDVDVGGDSGRRGDQRYQRLRTDDEGLGDGDDKVDSSSERLGFKATAKLSLEFCLVWVRDNHPRPRLLLSSTFCMIAC